MITVTITGLALAAVNGFLLYKIVEQKKEIRKMNSEEKKGCNCANFGSDGRFCTCKN